MPDIGHACWNCGYDKRVGEHMAIRNANDLTVTIQCRVPANSEPITTHRVTNTYTK